VKCLRRVALLCGALAAAAPAFGESAEQAIVRLEKHWIEKGDGTFSDDFWHVAVAIADQQGTRVIKLIMRRSRHWKGEEGLIYVPLLACLPRDETIAILKKYQGSKHEMERLFAEEFLVELDMPDTREAVEHFRSKANKAVDPTPGTAPRKSGALSED